MNVDSDFIGSESITEGREDGLSAAVEFGCCVELPKLGGHKHFGLFVARQKVVHEGVDSCGTIEAKFTNSLFGNVGMRA